MRFFSRITFICNCCFIIAVILRWVEINKRVAGDFTGAIGFQPLESTIVILGYGAVFLNLIYLGFSILGWLLKKNQQIPRWIVLFNIIIFPFQIYFFFFYK